MTRSSNISVFARVSDEQFNKIEVAVVDHANAGVILLFKSEVLLAKTM